MNRNPDVWISARNLTWQGHSLTSALQIALNSAECPVAREYLANLGR